MKYLSTFTGIGGFELGIIDAHEANRNRTLGAQFADGKPAPKGAGKGLKMAQVPLEKRTRILPAGGRKREPICIGYSEIDKHAAAIYQRQFPTHKNFGDITRINPGKLPDFDLLVGGFPCQAFSLAGRRRGFDDTRGTLFFEIARIVKQKQPRLLLLENVKGLLSHDKGRTFATILAALDELGYDTQWQVLNSRNFGVPQNRERVFIVGHRRGTRRPKVFPIGPDNQADHVLPTLTARYYGAQGTGGYIRHEPKTQPTLRKLTPIECERLQGFPDGWTRGASDAQRYKTLGNAVTVNVISAICQRLFR